ncbi:MAG: single-stranded DNA-binding protein [Spirulina sp. SIO3F2]|nr:single-stranded DNA-binding protein [Spirulina sp. SIO3F2]
MNSCILMARIVEAPVRRMTPDGQSVLADMFVEFDSLRDTDPPQRLRAVGWGNLAEDINQNYQVGDVVILQGSLRMSTFDRPEGFKEKRAELNISKIYKQAPGMGFQANSLPTAGYGQPDNVVPMGNYSRPPEPAPMPAAPVAPPPAPAPAPAPSTLSDDDLDNIPF